MTDTYKASRWIATATGCAAMALIGWSNVSKVRANGVAWDNPTVWQAGSIAALGAAGIYFASRWFAQGQRVLAMLLVVGVGMSETGQVYNLLEGLLLGRDARIQLIRDHNASIDLANATKATADKAVAQLEAAVEAETRAGGCKSICKDLKAQLAAAQAEAKAKAQAVESLGARRSETNIVATTLGLNEVLVEAAPPLLTTLSFVMLAMLLLAYGHGTAPPLATLAASEPSLDDKTARILEAIRASGGSLPSNQALATLLNVSEAQASKLATALVESGHIERKRDGKRAELRLVKAA